MVGCSGNESNISAGVGTEEEDMVVVQGAKVRKRAQCTKDLACSTNEGKSRVVMRLRSKLDYELRVR